MTAETIFHKILRKEIPAIIVHEDEDVLAFKDIHPQSPTHILFIPKHFLESIAHATPETAHIPGMFILKVKVFAKEIGIDG